jgi:hypothetical protein
MPNCAFDYTKASRVHSLVDPIVGCIKIIRHPSKYVDPVVEYTTAHVVHFLTFRIIAMLWLDYYLSAFYRRRIYYSAYALARNITSVVAGLFLYSITAINAYLETCVMRYNATGIITSAIAHL